MLPVEQDFVLSDKLQTKYMPTDDEFQGYVKSVSTFSNVLYETKILPSSPYF